MNKQEALRKKRYKKKVNREGKINLVNKKPKPKLTVNNDLVAQIKNSIGDMKRDLTNIFKDYTTLYFATCFLNSHIERYKMNETVADLTIINIIESMAKVLTEVDKVLGQEKNLAVLTENEVFIYYGELIESQIKLLSNYVESIKLVKAEFNKVKDNISIETLKEENDTEESLVIKTNFLNYLEAITSDSSIEEINKFDTVLTNLETHKGMITDMMNILQTDPITISSNEDIPKTLDDIIPLDDPEEIVPNKPEESHEQS